MLLDPDARERVDRALSKTFGPNGGVFAVGDTSSLLCDGRPVPDTPLPAVEGLLRDGKPVPGIANADFKGVVSLVNVWASWCVPCHDEAPLLVQLGMQVLTIEQLLDSPAIDPVETDDDDVALLQLTSGSTGLPTLRST